MNLRKVSRTAPFPSTNLCYLLFKERIFYRSKRRVFIEGMSQLTMDWCLTHIG